MYQLLGSQIGKNTYNSLAPNRASSLLSGCIKCSQNEERLIAEKSQRNILKKYLTQATGNPIEAALISDRIPGKGFGDTLDLGLGTKNTIMQNLGLNAPQTPNLLGINQGVNNFGGLIGNNNFANIANLGQSQNANVGLLNNLVNLASTPNNGSIMSNLGGLGSGLLGSSTANNGGLLGNIQSGVNTLNTINKVNNAVSGVKGLFA